MADTLPAMGKLAKGETPSMAPELLLDVNGVVEGMEREARIELATNGLEDLCPD